MGLDMHLRANRILSPMEEARIDDIVRDAIREILDLEQAGHTTTVQQSVGYLRKAYGIHVWCLAHASLGRERDGTKRYFLTHRQIADLHAACAEVLVDPSRALALLPPQADADETDLGERYFDGLRQALPILAAAVALPEAQWNFEYAYSA